MSARGQLLVDQLWFFLRIAKINDVCGFGALIWAKVAFNRPHRIKTYREKEFKPSFKDSVSVVMCP